MEKAFRILVIIIVVSVGLFLLSFVLGFISDVLYFINDNYTLIVGIVAAISGLIFLASDKEDNSSASNIAVGVFIISGITLVGIFVGYLMEQGIASLFK
ncbi:MAG: hypothetical protein ACJA1H_001594 [Glaciecola sp.]|jgi:hypothetical protein